MDKLSNSVVLERAETHITMIQSDICHFLVIYVEIEERFEIFSQHMKIGRKTSKGQAKTKLWVCLIGTNYENGRLGRLGISV